MIFEWSVAGSVVALAWALTVSPRVLPAVVLAFLVFSFRSVPASLLVLLAIQVLGFIRMCTGVRRQDHASTLKWFILAFTGTFISLFGAALGDAPAGHPLLVTGLLLSIPNVITLFFFGEFFERQTFRSLVGSVLIPAFVSIEILLKTKSASKSGFGEAFDALLPVLGGLGLMGSALLAFLRQRIKPVLIHWSLAWVGMSLLMLPFDSGTLTPIVFAALAVFSVTGAALLGLAAQTGPRHFSFAKAAASGLPGTIGFTVFHGAVKTALGASPLALVPVFLAQALLGMTLVSCGTFGPPAGATSGSVRARFWIVCAVQWISGCGLFWYGLGGVK